MSKYYTYEDINKMIRFLKVKNIAQMQYFFGGKMGVRFVNNNKSFRCFYDYTSRCSLSLDQVISMYKESKGEEDE